MDSCEYISQIQAPPTSDNMMITVRLASSLAEYITHTQAAQLSDTLRGSSTVAVLTGLDLDRSDEWKIFTVILD